MDGKESSWLLVISSWLKTAWEEKCGTGPGLVFRSKQEQAIQGMGFGANRVRIGILAVQGDFEAHAAMLEQLGVETLEVRQPADLENCDGLILPGGESTTQLQFLQEEGLSEEILKFAARRHFRDVRGRDSAGHRSLESKAGFVEAAGYDRAAQRLWAASCERCGSWPVEAEEGTARNGFHPRADYRAGRGGR